MSKAKFFNPAVTIDVVIFTLEENELKVLTIKRADEPFKGVRALPGGFIREGENSRTTAERILKDKAGLSNVYLEQLYTFDDPHRDPRGQVISISYYALIPREKLDLDLAKASQEPSLEPVRKLKSLAFDHNAILSYALERLRSKLEYTSLALSLLPEKFTFAELQKVYEIIFGRDFDKRNFRKKVFRLELIKPTKEKVKKGRQRPALLYRATSKTTQKFKNVF